MKKRVSQVIGVVAILLGIALIAIDMINGDPFRMMALIPIAVGIVAIAIPRFAETQVS